MKKINNLTYLNAQEVYDLLEQDNKSKGIFSIEDIERYLDEGQIAREKIDDMWHASTCDVFFFFNSLIKNELYSKQQYGGAIGVDLSTANLCGRILDIGGGGEAIISQLKGDSVVAIDPNRQELQEAPGCGLKIEMDAKDMKFLHSSFDTVTSFFTLMYIPIVDHKQVFDEVYKVLKPGGEFVVWDIAIPEAVNESKLFYTVFLEVTLPHKTVHTGYGTRWSGRQQSSKYFIGLGEAAGFSVEECSSLYNQGYMIRFRK